MAQHLARRLGKNDLLANAGRGDLGNHPASRLRGARLQWTSPMARWRIGWAVCQPKTIRITQFVTLERIFARDASACYRSRRGLAAACGEVGQSSPTLG